MDLEHRIELAIERQPDDTTCGPTCLQAVYRFFGDELPLDQVIREVRTLDTGGTLAVLLASHALRRGYRAELYTYNFQVFDPTWFRASSGEMREDVLRQRLAEQSRVKGDAKLRHACDAYIEFLDAGGELRCQVLSGQLLRDLLDREVPVLTGLSATYLYFESREIPTTGESDDVRGDPSGHFVVLCGYDRGKRQVLVADPLHDPQRPDQIYVVDLDRLLGSILLGTFSYDGNLLILEPPAAGGS